MKLSYPNDGYTFQHIADTIMRDWAGRPKGTKLPGERHMAVEYGVAVLTIRRALRELRERGTIRTLPGKGTFLT